MKVLITDDVHPIMFSGLKKMGYKIDYQPDIFLADLPGIIPNYHGIVINSKIKMTEELIDKAIHLKFIARLGSGLEIINLHHASEKKIAVFNAPGGNRNAVAEHATAMLLAASNNILNSDKEVKNKIWRREANRGFELENKSIGILGFGNTGSSFARKLMGFNIKIFSFDKFKKNYALDLPYVEETDLQTVLENSDIISLHLPLTNETKYLVNDDFLKKCKNDIIIINTSRGAIVKLEDLLIHLDSGKVKFACLDVFENEKPETFTPVEEILYTRLFSKDNVILSPHVAGWSFESKKKLSQVLLNKIDKWRCDIDTNG